MGTLDDDKPGMIARIKQYSQDHPTAFALSLLGLGAVAFVLGSMLQGMSR